MSEKKTYSMWLVERWLGQVLIKEITGVTRHTDKSYWKVWGVIEKERRSARKAYHGLVVEDRKMAITEAFNMQLEEIHKAEKKLEHAKSKLQSAHDHMRDMQEKYAPEVKELTS